MRAGALAALLTAVSVVPYTMLAAVDPSFATTALFLVVIMASRGLTGTDHVNGREPGQ